VKGPTNRILGHYVEPPAVEPDRQPTDDELLFLERLTRQRLVYTPILDCG
jgi:hypothetical protein